MKEEQDVGFLQGIVFACGFLAADHDEPTMAEDLWNQTGYAHDDVRRAAEFDVAKFRKAIPGLPKGLT